MTEGSFKITKERAIKKFMPFDAFRLLKAGT